MNDAKDVAMLNVNQVYAGMIKTEELLVFFVYFYRAVAATGIR